MATVIRVNLIPFREIRRAGRQRVQCFWVAAAVALTVIALVAFTWSKWKTESELAAQLETVRRTIAAGKSKPTTVARLEQDLDAHRKLLSGLEQLGHPRVTHDNILRRIATAAPNALWVTHLALKADALTLEGQAMDHTTIAQFLGKLKTDSRFTDNQLVEIHDPNNGSKYGNKRFSIKSRIVNHTANDQKDRATPE